MIRAGRSRGLGYGPLSIPPVRSIAEAAAALAAIWRDFYGTTWVRAGGDVDAFGKVRPGSGDPWSRHFLLMGG